MPDAARIDDLLGAQRERGIAAAVSRWTPEAGTVTRWTSPEGSGAPEPTFLVYSITKTFIACLLLQLAEAGRLDLDAPVTHLWRGAPLPPAFTDAVTTRRLLNHTAGVPDYGGLPEYHAQVRQQPDRPWTTDEFTQATLAQAWTVPMPARFAYSNPGYMVLRQLLEAVGERPWQVQLAERVCRPLGLTRTTVATGLADLLPLAPGLSRLIEGDEPIDVRGRYHPGWVSHGVIASTASEVTHFLQALFTGRLLRAHSLAAMVETVPVGQVGGRWRQPAYGLGLMIDPGMPLGTVRGHNGGGPGSRWKGRGGGRCQVGCVRGLQAQAGCRAGGGRSAGGRRGAGPP